MYGNNYNKNSDNFNSSNENIFNISGQNVMSDKRNIDSILSENKKLRTEIMKKDKAIEEAKKRINILQREIE